MQIQKTYEVFRSIRSIKELDKNEHEYEYNAENDKYVFYPAAFRDRMQSPSVYCVQIIGKPENIAKLSTTDGLVKLSVSDIENSTLCCGPDNQQQLYYLMVIKQDVPDEINQIKRSAHHVIIPNPNYISKGHFNKVRNILAALATAVGFFEHPIE